MNKNAIIFDEIVDKRRAYRVFDAEFKLPESVVKNT